MVTSDSWSFLINTLSALINLSFHLSKRPPFSQFVQMFDSLLLIWAATTIFHSDSSPVYVPEFETTRFLRESPNSPDVPARRPTSQWRSSLSRIREIRRIPVKISPPKPLADSAAAERNFSPSPFPLLRNSTSTRIADLLWQPGDFLALPTAFW